MPKERHSSASATSTAKIAGCAIAVSSMLVARSLEYSAPTRSKEVPSALSHSSITARNTGEV